MSVLPNPAQFALAGYRISPTANGLHFVSAAVGPADYRRYRYIGFIRCGVFFPNGSAESKTFQQFWK
jgi:hypothetical protein